VLLTRSPLSPGPKPWFSLDLHVLSAPPAFVLSQDQTLREDLVSPRLPKKPADDLGWMSLKLKVIRPQSSRTLTGCLGPQPKGRGSRRFTLLSFQRPLPVRRERKKASGSDRRPSELARCCVVSELRPKALLTCCRGRSYARPLRRLANGSRRGRGVKRRESA
jgi:hypothetical protein